MTNKKLLVFFNTVFVFGIFSYVPSISLSAGRVESTIMRKWYATISEKPIKVQLAVSEFGKRGTVLIKFMPNYDEGNCDEVQSNEIQGELKIKLIDGNETLVPFMHQRSTPGQFNIINPAPSYRGMEHDMSDRQFAYCQFSLDYEPFDIPENVKEIEYTIEFKMATKYDAQIYLIEAGTMKVGESTGKNKNKKEGN